MQDDTAEIEPMQAPRDLSTPPPGTMFADLPVEVTVSVGRARPTISALLALKPDSVVALDKSIDDPVEVYVGDHLIARGILEEVEEEGQRHLAVRLTSVPGLSDKG